MALHLTSRPSAQRTFPSAVAIDGASQAPTADPGGTDRSRFDGHRRRRVPHRVAAAMLAGAAIALLSALPATAAWPVASRSSYVSQWYRTGHPAMDLADDKWTRVVPVKSGKVVFAGWKSNCGGYQVWVSHGDGLYTAYYHLAREVTYRGAWVTGGSETIGYVGTTGCATGPHLHIEVWRGYPWSSGSGRVNPWNYVDAGYFLPYRYR